jgi:hypothetical protein
MATSPDASTRAEIAASPSAPPEVLFLLAADPDAAVRRAVADNPAMPPLAARLLCGDADHDVRAALAARLAALLPGAGEAATKTERLAAGLLSRLAADQIAGVRRAVATALKDHGGAPALLCQKLARAVEREVAEPLLLHCAKLSDEDLLAALAAAREPWAARAVARRRTVSEAVSAAVADVGDDVATGHLIRNVGAAIPAPTMDRIVAGAETRSDWQEALAERPGLPPAAAEELARFVDGRILDILVNRQALPPEKAADIVATVRRRIRHMAGRRRGETVDQWVRRLYLEGGLREDAIWDAVSLGEYDFVKRAVALLSEVRLSVVEVIVASADPRAVAALAWRARLSPALAYDLQVRMTDIDPARFIPATRGGGERPPEPEMLRVLAAFGAKAA